MACPLFEPDEPLDWSLWPGAYRPPLGRPYGGTCRSDPRRPYQPERGRLLECCNMGYARGRCSRLPAGSADAVRFALSANETVRWVVEKDHLPVAHGVSHGSDAGGGPARPPAAQLEAYRRSFISSGEPD